MNAPDDTDYQRRFGGIRRLYGAAAAERLRRARVCVIGIGGVGSWTAEALARSGVGALTLVDLDHVAESNINRQVHALDGELGKAKVAAMAARIHAIHPGCAVTQIEEFIAPENQADILGQDFDAVVDCIDSARAKIALIGHCRGRGMPLVTVGGAGGRTDPTRIRVADLARSTHDPLLARVRAALRREHGFPHHAREPFGVPCVYSEEAARAPRGEDAACAPRAGPDGAGGEAAPGAPEGAFALSCAGYGSSVCVTAAFGLAAAARSLELVLAGTGGRFREAL